MTYRELREDIQPSALHSRSRTFRGTDASFTTLGGRGLDFGTALRAI